MTPTGLNITLILALAGMAIMLIREAMRHTEAAMAAEEYRQMLDRSATAFGELYIAYDRAQKAKVEAIAIADHAIDVIAEAKDITRGTIYEARVRELERAFVDRRQKKANDAELKAEIDKLTGDKID